MKFIPNSEAKNEMLKEIGIKSMDELFSDIPKKVRTTNLNINKGLTQQETEKKLRKIAEKNVSCNEHLCFLGGGIKLHFMPSAVKALASRSEFFTAYTPYQSEASQGFLQAMFEYQSMIAELTGMDVANCSLYDGVTALSEAALMCSRILKKKTFIIPHNISWEKKCVLGNYAKGSGIKIKEIKYDYKTGKVDLSNLKQTIDNETAGFYIENPNFFGIFEDDVNEISKIVNKSGSLFVVGVDPISLGVTKSPGDYGADIVIGEGRALGNTMDFGGSSLGIFACKKEYLRQIPGRLIGLTKDAQSKRAFCMALQTREQHIRRSRATSNICTNEGICALTASIYLSWLGSNGLEKLARTNLEKGNSLAEKITSINGFEKRFTGFHFNEFVIETKFNINKIYKMFIDRNIQGGFVLSQQYPELKNCMLFGISEVHSDQEIDELVSVLKGVS
ncbi:MAG: aminomethyl-transferring glycine dehydrogenase subunit GcvPA [Thermoplasmatales archaeon]|nr:MAG: aminomethyl-transferring glycine dehydrogenase subunit GcvPA [Thermoplasmatales archaeon]